MTPQERKVMELALEALESSRIFVTSREKIKHPEGTDWYDERITAIKEALAQPQLKPLSDEEILNIHAMKCWVRVQFVDKKYGIALDTVTVRDFSRAIIAAHEAKRGGV